MRIDLKDKKILSVLDLNARETFQSIGKKTRLSKETVIYRIKNLEKKQIIQRYTTLVNFAKLGYTGYAVFNRFEKVNEEKKKEIIAFLSKIPELYWLALVGGKYDLVFAIMCKSVFQFNQIYYNILGKYGNFLVDNTIQIRTELRQNKRDYLSLEKKKKFESPFFGKEPEVEILDELDSNILSILSNNARLQILDISRILNKSSSTIASRIKGMEKRSIIQAYTTYIKTQNFGMQSYRLLLFLEGMKESVRNKIFQYVYENPNTILAIETVGKWNFEITIEVESHEELQKEISNLRNSILNIKNVEFLIMFEDDLIYDPYPLKKNERKFISSN